MKQVFDLKDCKYPLKRARAVNAVFDTILIGSEYNIV